jgi:hypothetical protein
MSKKKEQLYTITVTKSKDVLSKLSWVMLKHFHDMREEFTENEIILLEKGYGYSFNGMVLALAHQAFKEELKDVVFKELYAEIERKLKGRHSTSLENREIYKQITFQEEKANLTGEKKSLQKICSDLDPKNRFNTKRNNLYQAYLKDRQRHPDLYELDKQEAIRLLNIQTV